MRRPARHQLGLVSLVVAGMALGAAAVLSAPDLFDRFSDTGPPARTATPQVPTGPFVADDTTIEQCAGEPRCLEQAWGNLVIASSPQQVARRFEQAVGTGSLGVACHQVSHSIGRAALAYFDDDVARALADGTAACQSGYYHGVMQAVLDGMSDRQARSAIAQMCSEASVQATPHLLNNCLHGLGHGTMIYRVYELDEALELCDLLPQQSARGSCHSGTFMENFNRSYQVESSWLRDDDLLHPCPSMPARYKASCYYAAGGHVVARHPGQWELFARTCSEAAEPVGRTECFRALGAYAAALSRYDVATVRRTCALDAVNAEQCLVGAARGFVADSGQTARAGQLCAAAPGQLQRSCYGAIGSQLWMFEPQEAARKRACAQLTREYLSSCVRGLA